jgi:hypothetical protein
MWVSPLHRTLVLGLSTMLRDHMGVFLWIMPWLLRNSASPICVSNVNMSKHPWNLRHQAPSLLHLLASHSWTPNWPNSSLTWLLSGRTTPPWQLVSPALRAFSCTLTLGLGMLLGLFPCLVAPRLLQVLTGLGLLLLGGFLLPLFLGCLLLLHQLVELLLLMHRPH